jgi:hypothetical protein
MPDTGPIQQPNQLCRCGKFTPDADSRPVSPHRDGPWRARSVDATFKPSSRHGEIYVGAAACWRAHIWHRGRGGRAAGDGGPRIDPLDLSALAIDHVAQGGGRQPRARHARARSTGQTHRPRRKGFDVAGYCFGPERVTAATAKVRKLLRTCTSALRGKTARGCGLPSRSVAVGSGRFRRRSRRPHAGGRSGSTEDRGSRWKSLAPLEFHRLDEPPRPPSWGQAAARTRDSSSSDMRAGSVSILAQFSSSLAVMSCTR